jgi:signal transduction histidine kinase
VADAIAIAVEDDGVGFDVADATRSGRGLANLRQRAALLEAKLEIESRPVATRVCLRLPVQLRDAGCR